MNVADLSRVDRTTEIAAPPERVWQALTDVKVFSEWFQVTIEGRIAPGGSVWMTSMHPGYAGQRFQVWYIELDAPRRLVWQWHPGEVDPALDYSGEPRTTVTFTLEPSGTGTKLTVSETGFDQISLARRAKVYADNSQGWTDVLVLLQRYAEAGR
ncbi:MAG: vanillate O-demethylase oxidoreductase VanB [Acidobacteria bacterium]|nr:MAG: vanillate O-demethylase oxidoreductase VanB [Acidobacteriota bacterium]